MLHFLSQSFRGLELKLRAEGKRDYQYGYDDLDIEVENQKFGDEKKPGEGGNISSIDGLLWRLRSRFQKKNSLFLTMVRGETPKETGDAVGYPVFTLLEEAHRFAPAGASVVSTNILKQILSEGRKFGVGIGLITQRPGKLDQDVLSQCDADHYAHRESDRSANGRAVGRGRGPRDARRTAGADQRPGHYFGRRHQHAGDVPHPQAPDETRRRNLRRAGRVAKMAFPGIGRETRRGGLAVSQAGIGEED
ncbi:MAG: ATP-binding protein [Acidobacteria bacterium]|nr:ATP-binding protein [Acidobacteriota bacterium]